MSGQWHKVSPEELAKFVTRDAVRLIKLKVDRRAVEIGRASCRERV